MKATRGSGDPCLQSRDLVIRMIGFASVEGDRQSRNAPVRGDLGTWAWARNRVRGFKDCYGRLHLEFVGGEEVRTLNRQQPELRKAGSQLIAELRRRTQRTRRPVAPSPTSAPWEKRPRALGPRHVPPWTTTRSLPHARPRSLSPLARPVLARKYGVIAGEVVGLLLDPSYRPRWLRVIVSGRTRSTANSTAW